MSLFIKDLILIICFIEAHREDLRNALPRWAKRKPKLVQLSIVNWKMSENILFCPQMFL